MKQRIDLLDFWRSLSVLLMLLYHGIYDLEQLGVLPAGSAESPWALGARYLCAGSFILISGACLQYSRDSVRRGFTVFLAGAAVTLVTALLKRPVAFGIRQLLGVSMMLCGALREKLTVKNGSLFSALCLLGFVATLFLTKAVTVPVRWLYPLGLRYEGFYSADYYPLFPWLFLFLLGMRFGTWLSKQTKLCALRIAPVLTFAGRHSLIIYLLHQPIFFCIVWLLFHN